MCGAQAHVRFTPNSDRESGHPQKVMSALPLKADMGSAATHVCFGPIADMGHHSMMRSARNRTKGGTERPTVFAALMLSTVSNLVARSTGRLAGLTPLRILSTNKAARLHIS